jgi:hypothetical protein
MPLPAPAWPGSCPPPALKVPPDARPAAGIVEAPALPGGALDAFPQPTAASPQLTAASPTISESRGCFMAFFPTSIEKMRGPDQPNALSLLRTFRQGFQNRALSRIELQ